MVLEVIISARKSSKYVYFNYKLTFFIISPQKLLYLENLFVVYKLLLHK